MIASHYPPANYWFNFKTPICSWSDCILNKKPEACCEHIWQWLCGFHCPTSLSSAANAGIWEGVLPTWPWVHLAGISTRVHIALQHSTQWPILRDFQCSCVLNWAHDSVLSGASHPAVEGKPFGLVSQGCFSDEEQHTGSIDGIIVQRRTEFYQLIHAKLFGEVPKYIKL